MRSALLTARASRVRPARDDKVVAAWNGLAISAFAETGLLLGRPDFIAAARDAAALLAAVHLADGRLIRTSRDGTAGGAATGDAATTSAGRTAGVLEDYACVAEGFLTLSGVTGEARWLTLAGELIEVALAAFGDGAGGFYDTAADGEPMIFRPADAADNATPSVRSPWRARCSATPRSRARPGTARPRRPRSAYCPPSRPGTRARRARACRSPKPGWPAGRDRRGGPSRR